MPDLVLKKTPEGSGIKVEPPTLLSRPGLTAKRTRCSAPVLLDEGCHNVFDVELRATLCSWLRKGSLLAFKGKGAISSLKLWSGLCNLTRREPPTWDVKNLLGLSSSPL